jgi:hypothetical protein
MSLKTITNQCWQQASWKCLKEIVQRHEATLIKRWAKKSKSQQVQFLLKAWPGMSLNHRPDHEAFRNETPQQVSRLIAFFLAGISLIRILAKFWHKV